MEATFKQIADQIGLTYYFEDWSRANFALDGSRFGDLPALLDILPAAGQIIENPAGMIITETERQLWFIGRNEMDSASEDDWNIVEAMTAKAREFLTRLNATHRYRYISNVQWRADYTLLTEHLGGIGITFTLTPLDGVCVDNLLEQ